MRTYVVTGSASGIGAATSTLLGLAGHRVIGVDRHNAEIQADLSHADGRTAMIEAVRTASTGRIDGVIACAGVSGGQHSADPVIRVNYFGVIATIEGLRPLLAAGKDPRAAVVASIALLNATDDGPTALCLAGDEEGAVAACDGDGRIAYAAAKRGISRWVRLHATTAEWAGAGIALNAVAPGMIRTPMSEYYLGTDEQRAAALSRGPQPFGGIGTPEHIAEALVWLTSPQNGYVTGQILFVDGGYEAVARPGAVVRRGD